MSERVLDEGERRCPWCSAPAAPHTTKCAACGATIVQREAVAALVIPGVTSVDPALAAYAAQPTQLRGPSPSQGLASSAVAAAVAGGPVALAALGGLAAVAAVEYLGAGRGKSSGPVDLETLGTPSGYGLQALERIERGDADTAGARAPHTSRDPEVNSGS
jgi:hypothetical protein